MWRWLFWWWWWRWLQQQQSQQQHLFVDAYQMNRYYFKWAQTVKYYFHYLKPKHFVRMHPICVNEQIRGINKCWNIKLPFNFEYSRADMFMFTSSSNSINALIIRCFPLECDAFSKNAFIICRFYSLIPFLFWRKAFHFYLKKCKLLECNHSFASCSLLYVGYVNGIVSKCKSANITKIIE